MFSIAWRLLKSFKNQENCSKTNTLGLSCGIKIIENQRKPKENNGFGVNKINKINKISKINKSHIQIVQSAWLGWLAAQSVSERANQSGCQAATQSACQCYEDVAA